MLTGSHEKISQESLQIKQDNKFFSRLMSKETSMANSSSRVYYGGASGSVPFIWESQPGTPKHPLFNDNTIPPLTPPPSYQSISKSNTIQKNTKPNHLLSYIFPIRPIIRSKKNHVTPSSSSWSCTSSSSSSSCSSSNLTNSKKSMFHRRNFSLTRLIMNIDDEDDEEEEKKYGCGRGSPTSTLCFNGVRNKRKSSK